MYINPEKQSKHVPGGEKYEALLKKMGRKPSYFTCDTNELSKLFKKYAGTGQKEYGRKNGKMTWNNKEVIIANRKIIGYVVKEDSTEVPTSYFKIHYSKSGAHLVPLDPKKGERYEKIYRDGVAISWHRGH